MAKKKAARSKPKKFRVLCLDGGGSRGVFTLGVLKEIEAVVGKRLYKCFDLFYGTSTGSIIATLLACGESVEAIEKEYMELVPAIMSKRTASGKTKALEAHAKDLLGSKSFKDCKKRLGIVAIRCDQYRPMIFKSSANMAQGQAKTFVAGFGAPLHKAVIGSCSAYPYFKKSLIRTKRDGEVLVMDGGYVANDPSFYALTDATAAIKKSQREVAALSIGTGDFPPIPPGMLGRLKKTLATPVFDIDLAETIMRTNANSLEQLRQFLLPEVSYLRINQSYSDPTLQTTFLESSPKKLKGMYNLGRTCFSAHEDGVNTFFTD